MASITDLDIKPLLDAGYKPLSQKEWQAEVDRLTALGMNNGGTYDFGYELKSADGVTILIEQNTSTIAADGLETMTKHPAVAMVVGKRGKVTCPAHDFDLILAMADEVR